jgi:trehalose 6-phosphate phosphatase
MKTSSRSRQTRPQMVSLQGIRAVIFDLDGVVTQTARIHAYAWKRLFDEFFTQHYSGTSVDLFDIATDYSRYVDGKPRYEGVASFLKSRSINLPWGDPTDAEDALTIYGLGNRKDRYFRAAINEVGIDVYESTVTVIHQLKSVGISVAVVSASRNCVPILKRAGLTNLFDTKVDGIDAEHWKLRGKPEPDTFLFAAEGLHIPPHQAIVVEDSLAGVEAGKHGRFKEVIGVDRANQRQALSSQGATVVVNDLSNLVFMDIPHYV